jgi:hypothetical protein
MVVEIAVLPIFVLYWYKISPALKLEQSIQSLRYFLSKYKNLATDNIEPGQTALIDGLKTKKLNLKHACPGIKIVKLWNFI